ncbi:MAG: hypothetical protein GY730_11545 [bacterium]|nr:hypothetical protein [bacterium]
MKLAVFGYSIITKTCIDTLLKLNCRILFLLLEEKKEYKFLSSFKNSNIETYIYKNINDRSLSVKISDFNPDYIFSIIFGYKVPEHIINLAGKAAINFHPGPLPGYRSANPYFWVIRNGERSSVVTIHKLTNEWDMGNIVYKKVFALNKYETIGSYNTRVNLMSPVIIEELYSLMINDKLGDEPQSKSRYLPQIKPSNTYINWNQPASSIESLVRACNPIHFAVCQFKRMLLEIIEVEPTNIPSSNPGCIVIKDNNLFVSSSDFLVMINIIRSTREGVFSGKRFTEFVKIKNGDFFYSP